MIKQKVTNIYAKLIKDQYPLSHMDLYDVDIMKIIEIITNECKSSIKDEKGNVRKYESPLDINMVRNLIIQFLSNKQLINNSAIRDVMNVKYEPSIYKPENNVENIIQGPTCNAVLEKKISLDGKNIEEVYFKNPIADNLEECLLGKNENQSKRIRKAVLEPYASNLINDNKSLKRKHLIGNLFNKIKNKKKDTNQIIEEFTNILSENLEPNVAKNTAIYLINNLLMNKSFFKDLQEKAKYR